MTSSADIANHLERHGWLRSVAGDRNFDKAVEVIQGILENGKGLLITGEYGRGKSMLADIVARALGATYKANLGVTNGITRLDSDYIAYIGEDPFSQSVYIDDLGAEPRTNRYGEKIEHAVNFINDWHQKHKPGTRLFVTTNLDTKQFDSRYGGRVLSRLKELCDVFILDGKDHRTCKVVDARERRV